MYPPNATEWHALTRGADVLGTVCVTGCDNFHMIGFFRPNVAFGKYEPLFAEVYRRWATDANDWLDTLEVVNALGLQLASTSGRVHAITDFHLESLEVVAESGGLPVSFKFTGSAASCVVKNRGNE